MLYDNINDAAHAFVAEFNAFPESMIETLMSVDIDSWSEVTTVLDDDDEDDYREFLPMWGTLWAFSDPTDIWWLEEKGGIETMSKLGFRIYHHEEWGISSESTEQDTIFMKHTGSLFTKQEGFIGTRRNENGLHSA